MRRMMQSAMTPLRRGLTATRSRGVRPIMSRARVPTASIRFMAVLNATTDGSRAYRLTVVAEAPSHRRNSAENVILLLESGDEPYRVLSWHNAFDGSAGKPL